MVYALLQVPLAVPHLAIAIALVTLIAPSGLIARTVYGFGWIAEPVTVPGCGVRRLRLRRHSRVCGERSAVSRGRHDGAVAPARRRLRRRGAHARGHGVATAPPRDAAAGLPWRQRRGVDRVRLCVRGVRDAVSPGTAVSGDALGRRATALPGSRPAPASWSRRPGTGDDRAAPRSRRGRIWPSHTRPSAATGSRCSDGGVEHVRSSAVGRRVSRIVDPYRPAGVSDGHGGAGGAAARAAGRPEPESRHWLPAAAAARRVEPTELALCGIRRRRASEGRC